jgi:putative flippase GtrA
MSIPRAVFGVFLSRQFATFVVFGGLAAIVNLAVGWLIYKHRLGVTLPYSMAVAIGAASGLLINFGLNYCFNFRFRERSAIAQFRTFFVVSLGGIALTSLLSWLTLQALPNSLPLPGNHIVSAKFASHFLAVGLVTFYSYAAHRYFTFNVGLRERHAQLLQGIQNARR